MTKGELNFGIIGTVSGLALGAIGGTIGAALKTRKCRKNDKLQKKLILSQRGSLGVAEIEIERLKTQVAEGDIKCNAFAAEIVRLKREAEIKATFKAKKDDARKKAEEATTEEATTEEEEGSTEGTTEESTEGTTEGTTSESDAPEPDSELRKKADARKKAEDKKKADAKAKKEANGTLFDKDIKEEE